MARQVIKNYKCEKDTLLNKWVVTTSFPLEANKTVYRANILYNNKSW